MQRCIVMNGFCWTTECLFAYLGLYPAAVGQAIQRYPLLYHQTTEQCLSPGFPPHSIYESFDNSLMTVELNLISTVFCHMQDYKVLSSYNVCSIFIQIQTGNYNSVFYSVILIGFIIFEELHRVIHRSSINYLWWCFLFFFFFSFFLCKLCVQGSIAEERPLAFLLQYLLPPNRQHYLPECQPVAQWTCRKSNLPVHPDNTNI